jgi:hypothetical protein
MRLYEHAAENAERRADAHDQHAAFVEQHGDAPAAQEHRQQSATHRAQAMRYREQSATARHARPGRGAVSDGSLPPGPAIAAPSVGALASVGDVVRYGARTRNASDAELIVAGRGGKAFPLAALRERHAPAVAAYGRAASVDDLAALCETTFARTERAERSRGGTVHRPWR